MYHPLGGVPGKKKESVSLDTDCSELYHSRVNDYSRCPTEGAIGLLALLINGGRHAEARLDDALVAVGLTFVKWRTLDALMKAGSAIPLTLLAQQLGCVKSNVTQLIDKLEADGVVRRIAIPEDRRSI